MSLPPQVIDFHSHIFPPWVGERRSELLQRDVTFATLYANPRARLATAEDLLKSMDRAGVAAAAALNIGWASHELCLRSNDYFLEAAARYSGRLIPFCAVQPQAGEAAVAELVRCAGAGARGLGELRPDTQGFSLSAETLAPLFQEAQKEGLLLLLHVSEPVGHLYPGKGTNTPAQLYPFLCRYPGLAVVAAHWGGGLPFYALMPEVARALKNVYFDTAASHLLYRPQVYPIALSLVGARKVLFGSDFPLIPQARALARFQEGGLKGEEAALILGGNARRLLKI